MIFCSKCKKEKGSSCFDVDQSRKNGLFPWCKECRKDYTAERRKNRPRRTVELEKARGVARRAKRDAIEEARDKYLLYMKDYSLKSRYNITIFEYNAMAERQQGRCAICDRSPQEINPDNPKSLCVDHDHSCCAGPKSCGACVRGLLCDWCNNGLGRFDDNPARMRRAISYLEHS